MRGEVPKKGTLREAIVAGCTQEECDALEEAGYLKDKGLSVGELMQEMERRNPGSTDALSRAYNKVFALRKS